MSYGFSLCGNTPTPNPQQVLSYMVQPPPVHPPSSSLLPSWPYCAAFNPFDPWTAASNLGVTGYNLLSIFFPFATLAHIYQSSLFLIALRSL